MYLKILANEKKELTMTQKMKEYISKIILLIFDIISIFISLLITSFIVFNTDITNTVNDNVNFCTFSSLPFYLIILSVFLYNGIYTQRFDFWEETRKVLKSLALSILLLFSYHSITNTTQDYPLIFIVLVFIIIAIIIPTIKNIIKHKLFALGYWKKYVRLLGENCYLEEEVFNNPYLGYEKTNNEETNIVFIDSHNKNQEDLKKQLEKEIQSKHTVMFLPVVNNYQFSNRDIYELSNTRTNLFILRNKLRSNYRMIINNIYNYLCAVLMLPFLLSIIGIIAIVIKSDSKGPIFFKQKRLGKNGKSFMVYKFRTMYSPEQQVELLDRYLQEHPEEIKNYEIYCKYENDPRVTKVGKKLRSTSLDELAQIFNVLKGDMNFIGPRPYLVTEKEKMGQENKEIILKTKPGITGLWQVSGRNELTFEERMDLDRWYIQNWSLWKDFVIFMKTISVVLHKVGAK